MTAPGTSALRLRGSRRPPGDGLVDHSEPGRGCDHASIRAPGGRGLPLLTPLHDREKK
jgi:hypothetical protein